MFNCPPDASLTFTLLFWENFDKAWLCWALWSMLYLKSLTCMKPSIIVCEMISGCVTSRTRIRKRDCHSPIIIYSILEETSKFRTNKLEISTTKIITILTVLFVCRGKLVSSRGVEKKKAQFSPN